MTSAADHVIDLTGELDLAETPALTAAIRQAIAARPGRLILDLAAVAFIDSTALRALIAARAEALAAGVPLLIREPSAVVEKVMGITGTAALFPRMDPAAGDQP